MDFTIVSKYGMLVMHEGVLKGAREEWRGAGIVFYILGSFEGSLHEQAGNLAMNKCEGLHIPVASLRRTGKRYNRRPIDTNTRRML